MFDIVSEQRGHNFLNDFVNDKKDHNIVNNKMFSSFGHKPDSLNVQQFCIMFDIVNEQRGHNFLNDFVNDKKDHNIVNNKMFSSFGHKPDSLNVVIFWESYPILCTCFCNRNSIFKKTIRQWRNADSGIN